MLRPSVFPVTLGARGDSYYEYLLKAYVLFGDDTALTAFTAEAMRSRGATVVRPHRRQGAQQIF